MATRLLVTSSFLSRFGHALAEAAEDAGLDLEPVALADERGATLPEDQRDAIDIAYMSGDLYPGGNFRGFFESLVACPDLRWVQVFYVGVEGPLWRPLFDRGVILTNAAGASAQSIAQTAIGGVLLLSRPFMPWLQAQREREWRPLRAEDASVPLDLRDQTMVIVGLGAIGAQIARLAKALDMTVVGVRRTPGPAEWVDEVVHPSRLDDVLPRANWLTLACPLTDETRGLIDARRLTLLPPGARIANVARGAVVEEEAMVAALAERRLGGAYLDVFTREPLPPESPLWSMPNVVVTPHNSSISGSNYRRQVDIFFDNLRRWGRGEPLRNRVTRL